MPLHNKKDHMDCVYYATDESALFRQYRLSDSTDIGLAGNGVSPLSRLVMNLLYPLCLL